MVTLHDLFDASKEKRISVREVLYASPLQLRSRLGENVELPEDRILVSRINAASIHRIRADPSVYSEGLERIYEDTQERKYRLNIA